MEGEGPEIEHGWRGRAKKRRKRRMERRKRRWKGVKNKLKKVVRKVEKGVKKRALKAVLKKLKGVAWKLLKQVLQNAAATASSDLTASRDAPQAATPEDSDGHDETSGPTQVIALETPRQSLEENDAVLTTKFVVPPLGPPPIPEPTTAEVKEALKATIKNIK